MLLIRTPDTELLDEDTGRIIPVRGQELRLEHSLVSISKWESKWKKPFLGNEAKTQDETTDYIRCMTLTQNVNPIVYHTLKPEHYRQINEYINDTMTATTFRNVPGRGGKGGRQGVITSEIIYYWMISLEIPVEFQTWHLNRLLTLIRVCNEKSQPGKKMSKKDVMSQYRSLNAARRARMGTRG